MSHKHHYRCHVDVRRCGGGRGFFSRTIRGLARKLGVPRGVIIVGFIMLFIMSAPLALVTFFVAWYWIKNPGRLEAAIDRAMESTRQAFGGSNARGNPTRPAAAVAGAPDEDLDFSELRAKFEELEARAGRMEELVSSDDYRLRRRFDDIEGKDRDT